MSRQRGGYYDEDDLDYDEYYEDDYGDYDDAPAGQPKKTPPKKPAAADQKGSAGVTGSTAKGKGKAKKPSAPAATAGASPLAQYLCDPPPSRPDGKLQKGVVKKVSKGSPGHSFPVSPADPGNIQKYDFNEPSPDDAVQAARTRGSDSRASASGVEEIGEGINELQVTEREEASMQMEKNPKKVHVRKPLSEYEMEPELVRLCEKAANQAAADGARSKLHLVVLGHVDAGKSTLMGRLLYDLGQIGQKEMHKNKKEAAQMGKASFSWAWALDERPEERERGVTVDIAMSRFQTEKYQVTLLDAPGHRDFVPNMISGAAQADAAMLCVDGSISGFEAGFEVAGRTAGGGQTREHAQLARTLGIEQLAVVVTKLDTCGFSKDRFEEVKALLLPFLLSCGFKEKSIQWLPASAPDGVNLTSPPESDTELGEWWDGSTVVGAINKFKPISRKIDVPLRLPVSDVFKTRSLGQNAVGGKVEGGVLRVGGKVLAMPAGEIGTIKALEVDGEAATVAQAGDSCDVGLTDIDASLLFPGSVLCTTEWPCFVAVKFELRGIILEPPVPIVPGQPVALHAHTVREEGNISRLISILNPKTGEVLKNKPRCLTKGQTVIMEITPARGMCLEEYGSYRALGRVALRQQGRTIAVGIVTKIWE
ncbi:hypothetical protein BSKO_10993 [Bryopsis sp. KO-2023]|nr:hypothetical protein BSKO_10993 [Bryopsis sp. KO-2023]